MTRQPSWFRRNRWALAAVAVLGAATVVYSFAFDWQRYQDRQPHDVIDVARGETVKWGPGELALTDLTVLAGDSDDGRRYEVAEGTDVVVADFHITPDPKGVQDDTDSYFLCDMFYRAPSPDGEREWWDTSTNPTTYPEPQNQGYGCNLGYGNPYDVRVYFIVPSGGAEDGYVLVSSPELLPRALHLH